MGYRGIVRMTAYKNKKAQISFFILIGIVLIGIFLFLFVTFTKTTETRQGTELIQTSQISADMMAVQEFTDSCFRMTTGNAFMLLGKQGGTIFADDGGAKQRGDMTLNEDYLYSEELQSYIAYSIKSFTAPAGQLANLPPDYPYIGFPMLGGSQTYFGGLFGFVSIPALEDPDNPSNLDTMKGQVKYYIENNMKLCTKGFENFPAMDVSEGKVEATITFHDGSTEVELYYPLTIMKKATNDQMTISDFKMTVPLKMKAISSFVRQILDSETSNILHTVAGKSYGTIKVKKIYADMGLGFDSIISMEDSVFRIEGQSFKFNLPVANRPPALHFIAPDDLITLAENWTLASSPSDILYAMDGAGVVRYSANDMLAANSDFRHYYDPDDDDELEVTYSMALPYKLTIDDTPPYAFVKFVVISVSDGEYIDTQKVDFEVI